MLGMYAKIKISLLTAYETVFETKIEVLRL